MTDPNGGSDYVLHLGSIERAVARRAAVVWILLRVLLAAFLLAEGFDPVRLDLRGVALVIAAVGAISLLDTRSRSEHILVANLGTTRWEIHLLGFGPATLGEIAVAVAARL